jgi:hemerythrin-like domain-containing protein
MADHAEIADLTYRITRALDAHDSAAAAPFVRQLAARFAEHSSAEENGLFHHLQAAGEAGHQIHHLINQHGRIRATLADPRLLTRPTEMRDLLVEIALHAETEDNDLFPFAIQVLPALRWDQINDPAERRRAS